MNGEMCVLLYFTLQIMVADNKKASLSSKPFYFNFFICCGEIGYLGNVFLFGEKIQIIIEIINSDKAYSSLGKEKKYDVVYSHLLIKVFLFRVPASHDFLQDNKHC